MAEQDISINEPLTHASHTSTVGPVSAADILRDLGSGATQVLKPETGIRTLDSLIGGGLEKGKVTEIWGPPGSGKTSIALATARRVMLRDKHVTWFNCAQPLSSTRFTADQTTKHSDLLHQIYPPTLSHLIVVAKYPETFLEPCQNDLLVIDDLSALVDLEYPRQSTFTTSADSDTRKWQAGRRTAVLGSIVSYLGQLAVTHNVAVLVINGCATTSRSRSGQSAVLVSAVGGLEWEAGIWCRVALFRDFNGHFAALQRSRGSNVPASSFLDHLAHFAVGANGTATDVSVEARSLEAKPKLGVANTEAVNRNKRKLEEIADSDGELDEYGWNGDEEFQLSEPEVQIID